MCEHINLRYHVPQLGEIECWICKPYAANCYNLLEKYEHIKRMESIDQLGVIRNVFEGAHHPRWEYVMLQLYIVNLLQDSKALEGNGIGSNVKLGDGIELSCAEVLQIWILLLNSGHLPGTFATEKAILKHSKKNNTFKRSLQNGLPEEMKEFFKKVLEKENIYDVHKVLISFYLERYKRCRDYDVFGIKLIDILQKVLSLYVNEEEEDNKRKKQEKLQFIFKRLRQISYLFLDSQYAPFPINFSLFQILNSGTWLKDLFTTPTKSISKTLDAFEDLLSINLYHSSYSIRELGYHSKKIEKMLESDNGSVSGITDLKDYLLKDPSRFKPKKEVKWDLKPFNLLFDTKDDPSLKNFFKKYLTFEREKEWNDKLGNNCQLTFQSSPTLNHNVINLSLYNSSSEVSNMKSVAKFLKFLVNLHLDSKKEIKSDRIDSVIQKPYEELLVDILEHITNKTLYFEVKENNLNKRIISTRGAMNAKNEIEKIYEDISLEKSRKHEVEVLQAALKNIDHRTELIISLSEILVYNKEKKHLTDIDGIAFGIKNKQLKLLLIEAKKQKCSSLKSAKDQLADNFSKFNIKTSEEPVISDLNELGSVSCYLTVDGL